MHGLICRLGASAVVALLLLTMAATADDPAKKIEIIKLEEAPKAVRDAIEGRFPGGQGVHHREGDRERQSQLRG